MPNLVSVKSMLRPWVWKNNRSDSTCVLAGVKEVASRALRKGTYWYKRWFTEVNADDEDDEIHHLTEFKAVLASLNFEAIAEYAASIRKSQVPAQRYHVTPWSFECTVEENSPLNGSYNILFPIVFGDRTKWLLKIPSHGHDGRWNDSAAHNFRSEALTMRLLRKQGVPVPEVYAFNPTINDALNCPFILMEFMDGRSLYDGWFDQTVSKQTRYAFRERCLQSLASIMIQVNSVHFTQAGSPLYDEDGNLKTIGPLRVPDGPAGHNHLMKMMSGEAVTENFESYCDIGPFNDMHAYMTSMLDGHFVPNNQISQGEDALLRLFVEWSSQNVAKDSFVLAHPDLDLQNVLVDANGTVRALVDWDGVVAVPRSVGFSFPKWLMRDWDPDTYRYGYVDSNSNVGRDENSPEELLHYRRIYAQFLEDAMTKSNVQEAHVASYSSTLRQSVVIGSLRRAVTNPQSKADIVFKILDIVAKLTNQKSFEVKVRPCLEDSSGQWSIKADFHDTHPAPIVESDDSVSPHTTSLTTGSAGVEDLAFITPYITTRSTLTPKSYTTSIPEPAVPLRTSSLTSEPAKGKDVTFSIPYKVALLESTSHAGPENPTALAVSSKTTSYTGRSTDTVDLAYVTPKSTPPSTIISGLSPGSSRTTSVSSRASSLASEAASIENLDFSTPDIAPPFTWTSGSSSKIPPTLPVIDEEAAENITATPSVVAEVSQDACQHGVVSSPETPKLKKKSLRLRGTFRKAYKNMSSALALEKDTVFRVGGPTGLSLVAVVDNTMFDIVNAPVLGPDLPVPDETTSDSEDLAGVDAPEKPAVGQLALNKTSEAKAQADGTSMLGITSELMSGPNSKDAVQGFVQELGFPQLTNPFAKEHSSTRDGSDSQPSPQRKNSSLCGRVVTKLAYTCHTPDLESHPIPCKEIKQEPQHADSVMSQRRKKKRVVGWFKKAIRKTRDSKRLNALFHSSSADWPIVSTPSGSQDPDLTSSTNADASSEQKNSQGTPIKSGTNIFDLENLEPVDEDSLWNLRLTTGQILKDLADGKLDDARMQRLKAGFFALLDSL